MPSELRIGESDPDGTVCGAKGCEAPAVIVWMNFDIPLCRAHLDAVRIDMSGQFFTGLPGQEMQVKP